MEVTFSKSELERYSRHLILPEFNIEGQKRLKSSKVLVVGSGGLGSPLLLYLTAAGIGTIGIVDFDVVDETNLQRQILFGVDNVGVPKVDAAKKRLQNLNPNVRFVTYNTAITSENALEIIQDYDVVADGTDNFPTRYLVNDACVILGKTNVYASIFRFEGQISVFNYLNKSGDRGPNYRDLFPSPPPPGLVPSCAEGGVIGVLPGIIGCLQANEVLKIVAGIGDPLSGKLFLFDALTFTTRTLKINKNPNVFKIEKLVDYQEFCGLTKVQNNMSSNNISEITVQELEELILNSEDYQLIDVREPYEYDIANLQGELIPLDELDQHIDRIDRQKKVIVHCRSGRRSADAIKYLQEQYGFENLYNLKGGILAYAKEIDTSLARY